MDTRTRRRRALEGSRGDLLSCLPYSRVSGWQDHLAPCHTGILGGPYGWRAAIAPAPLCFLSAARHYAEMDEALTWLHSPSLRGNNTTKPFSLALGCLDTPWQVHLLALSVHCVDGQAQTQESFLLSKEKATYSLRIG